mmetsp:Transcript_8694/g.23357  ORF Transcript_8694/g.23357 Transcript_8694/m.23357 type:complete len:132 (-) Transcript_8694:1237-1632(-)|eukprot:715162-Pelagomonas_calceolata.AAC.1
MDSHEGTSPKLGCKQELQRQQQHTRCGLVLAGEILQQFVAHEWLWPTHGTIVHGNGCGRHTAQQQTCQYARRIGAKRAAQLMATGSCTRACLAEPRIAQQQACPNTYYLQRPLPHALAPLDQQTPQVVNST